MNIIQRSIAVIGLLAASASGLRRSERHHRRLSKPGPVINKNIYGQFCRAPRHRHLRGHVGRPRIEDPQHQGLAQ
ncbi:hypothetical protein LP420_30670 [Massilia sp. B-10]|nr:hypothetical protein LP420_30670 [Massilia sp. B-10]